MAATGRSAAVEQVSRMLALVPYITRRPGISIGELAAEFQVDPAQITADLNLLMVCGEPGYYPHELIDVVLDDADGTVSISYDAGLDRPVRLTAEESVTLTVALRALQDLPDLIDAEAIHSALGKLEDASGGPVPAVAIDPGRPTPAMATVRAGIDAGRRLWIRYYSASRDRLTEREIDPIRILVVDGRSYVEGYCYLAEAVRRFRLDRIDEIRMTDAPAQPPLWIDDTIPETLFTASAAGSQVALALTPEADWVAEYFAVQDLGLDDRGRHLVRVPAADDEFLVRLVLSLGAAATIVDRVDLADQVRERARQALVHYGRPGSSGRPMAAAAAT